MRFAFTDDQLAFRDAVRDLLAKECTPAARARRVDERRPAACPGCGTRSPRWACSACSRPRRTAGSGSTMVDLVLRARGDRSRARCPSRSSRPRRSRRRRSLERAPASCTASLRGRQRSVPWADSADVDRAPTPVAARPRPTRRARRRAPSVDGSPPRVGRRCAGRRSTRRRSAAPRPTPRPALDRGALGTAAQLVRARPTACST